MTTPMALALDTSGRVYVADYGNSRVDVFDPSGAYVTRWGSAGSNNGQFNTLYGIAVNSSGAVICADSHNFRIQEFSSAGAYLRQWGSGGNDNGRFIAPYDITVNSSGDIFVADTFNNRLQQFTPDGTYAGQWGTAGSGDGQFDNPKGIAVNRGDFVYVSDWNNNRIQVFGPDGSYISQWGSAGSGDGQLTHPRGLAINRSGYIYVADSGNYRVEVFGPDGTYVSQWGSYGTGDGQFNYPVSVAINSTGYVFVTDGNNNRVEIFDTGGNFISQWGTGGDGDGQYNFPEKIAIDGHDTIYIADWGNSRVQVSGPGGEYLTRIGAEGRANGRFSHPIGVGTDNNGNLCVADTYNNRIQKFSMVQVTTNRIPTGGSIAIGESGLDIADCTLGNTTIAWWPDGADPGSVSPDATLDVSSRIHTFSATPAEFAGRRGAWYRWAGGRTLANSSVAFRVLDPVSDIAVRDISTGGRDVSGKTVPLGDELGFELTTNLAVIAAERSLDGIPFNISITSPDGRDLPTLVNKWGSAGPLTGILVPSSPFETGGLWNSGNALYRNGTYHIRAYGVLDSLQSATPDRTITLSRTSVLILPAPVITSVPTASGYRNTTAAFTILGSNFQPGTGNTTVEFRNQTSALILTNLTNVTTSRIDGTIAIPAYTNTGSWNIRVITADGGEVTKMNAFSISNLSKPTISSMLPASPYYRNKTINYTITGTNFQPGNTIVLFRNKSGHELNDSIRVVNSGAWLVTPTKIYGTITVPFEASSATPYNITVTTLDGGTVARESAFTVSALPLKPTITSMLPAGPYYRNQTVNYTITGTNFQPDNTVVLFQNRSGTLLNATPENSGAWLVTPTKIYGTITVPFEASSVTPYNITVSTLDGGTVARESAFTISALPLKPTITSMLPAGPITGT